VKSRPQMSLQMLLHWVPPPMVVSELLPIVIGAVVVFLLLLSSWARAGEPPPPPPTGQDATVQAAKDLVSSTDDFDFKEDNRRDPFTFIRLNAAEVGGGVGFAEDGTQVVILPREEIQKKKAEIEAAQSEAERALMDGEAGMALQKADTGLATFSQTPGLDNLDKEGFTALKERLLRTRKAATQLKQRQNAEADFRGLNIRLVGVIATEKNPHAIINGKTVKKGDLVATASDNADVMVDDILPERVVFSFRGYRMMLSLSEIGR
jgi:hypothetical protein